MLFITLLIAASITTSYASGNCDAAAISIPIQDTKILDDIEDSYMIGLRTKLGTPSQDILLLPWAELNNTWVYDYQPYCDDTIIRNDLICRVRRSDYFFENTSSTFARATNMQAAGGATQETTYSGAETGIPDLINSSISGTDVIEMGSSNLTSFPIGIPRLSWDHGYTTIHALGLGSNSTILSSFLHAGQIASRSWSLFWGRMWVDDWVDGSLVLGGYNAKLSVGTNYTQALDYSNNNGANCHTGMKVVITGIDLNFSNGSNVNIYQDAFTICIVPQRQLLIEGPTTIREAFEKATGMVYQDSSHGIHWSAAQYLADGAYDGDMTITLSSGLAIRLPNSQFLPPYVDIADNGSRIYNNSIREFLYHGIGSAPATLGRYFFTAAQLTVNHDTNSFTLSEANLTTESDLIPIVSDSTNMACSDDTSSTGTEDTATTDSGETSHTTAIAGGVVGGVVFVLAVAGITAFMLVRRRRKRQNAYEPAPAVNMNQDKWAKTHEMGAYETPQELLGTFQAPPELPGNRPTPPELSGSQRLSEPLGRELPQGQQGDGPVYEMSSDTQRVY